MQKINYGSTVDADFVILGFPLEEGRFRQNGEVTDCSKTPTLMRKYLENFPAVRPTNGAPITQSISDIGNISANLSLENVHTLLANVVTNAFKISLPSTSAGFDSINNSDGHNSEPSSPKRNTDDSSVANDEIFFSYRKTHKKLMFIAGGSMDMLMPSIYGLYQSDLIGTNTISIGLPGRKRLITPAMHLFLISPDIPNMPLVMGKVHAGCQLRLLNECPGLSITTNIFGLSEHRTDRVSVQDVTQRGGSVFFDSDCVDCNGNTLLLQRTQQVLSEIKAKARQRKQEYFNLINLQLQQFKENISGNNNNNNEDFIALYSKIDNECFESDIYIVAIDMRVLDEGILKLPHILNLCEYFTSETKCKLLLVSDSDSPNHLARLCWSAICGSEARS